MSGMIRRTLVCFERTKYSKYVSITARFSTTATKGVNSLVPVERNVSVTERSATEEVKAEIDALKDADEILSSRYLTAPPPQYIQIDVDAPKVKPSDKLYVEDPRHLKSSDLGKYEKVGFSCYFGKCPEGVPQSMRKDFSLYDRNEREFGMMVRPQMLQLIRQMELFQKEQNPQTGDLHLNIK